MTVTMDPGITRLYESVTAALPGYEKRPVQELMMQTVFEALEAEHHAVIEAGTGSGKSFGYLLPMLASSKRPVVLSTGTIALQEQLMFKDIPFVLEATGLEHLSVQLVKGRRNYLCLQKLLEFEKTLEANAPERLYVNLMKSAFQDGWNGDKADLDFEIPYEIWEEVQSDSEDCLGNRCQFYKENPYRQAREHMQQADILVVNHALYLQDVASNQAVLPPHDVVIFDEAHQLKTYALKAFTARIGKFATNKLLRKIHRRLQSVPEDFQHAIFQTESQVLSWLFQHDKHTFKIRPNESWIRLIDQQVRVLTELQQWLTAMDVIQLPFIESDLDKDKAQVQRDKLLNQLEGLVDRWQYFLLDNTHDRVNWAEVNHDRLYYEIRSTPLNIADQFSKTLWAQKKAVLTSATLSTNRDLNFFRRELGLPERETAFDLVLESPFDYKNQCELYLPSHLPEPNDPLFKAAAVDTVVELLEASRGRAFVLFTSYGAMQAVSAGVIPRVVFPCKMQGDLPKKRLIEWFKDTPNSVLFATSSFWEGIDIPGDDLSCVIIDRIPFSTPDEPVHSAMIDRLKAQGSDWFGGYVLPEAIIRLKQGFGRLIRSKKDTGIVAILDNRLTSKGYGRTIIRSLPETKVIKSLAARKI